MLCYNTYSVFFFFLHPDILPYCSFEFDVCCRLDG